MAINSEDIDSEEYDAVQKIVAGLENWLKFREADYSASNTYGSQCQQRAIRGLIEEVQLCGENGELPWEVMKEKD